MLKVKFFSSFCGADALQFQGLFDKWLEDKRPEIVAVTQSATKDSHLVTITYRDLTRPKYLEGRSP